MSGLKQSRPKGTQDFVPPDSERRRQVEETFRRMAETYGYREIITPTFEHAAVFEKSSGTTSDIVTKENYTFRDRGGRDLTLRAEGTPGVVRAVLENRLRLPYRLYYVGPCFRYGRPQKGRFREFGQVGIEALGEASPLTDAEIIAFGNIFFARLGIRDCTTQVNSIGCRECRPTHRDALRRYLLERQDLLCDDCKLRIDRNPLRVFDCKVETCRQTVKDAPTPRQYLCPACQTHFEQVQADLTRRGLSYETNDRLVRGLDYYSRTVFEYISASLGAQDSLGGGGRYDYLVEEFGGPPTPGVGVAIGLERTMLVSPATPAPARRRLAFVVWLTETEIAAAEQLADRLRSDGIAAQVDYDARKVKGQFKSADAAAAACCIVIGPDELAKGIYSLKDLETGSQSEVPAENISAEVRALFAAQGSRGQGIKDSRVRALDP
ncbi:histidine--tRNA ligase [candidate division WOR-3 bacterium]|uniref:Histidine--tRNA ligase n=1 Tax=candidate division WOR-3 bacterium TaxID=2052148 RepID=A0A938BUK8_UNCW3|nr:histidine--tRNA ligase [candidate division WOR-3 bacterium]